MDSKTMPTDSALAPQPSAVRPSASYGGSVGLWLLPACLLVATLWAWNWAHTEKTMRARMRLSEAADATVVRAGLQYAQAQRVLGAARSLALARPDVGPEGWTRYLEETRFAPDVPALRSIELRTLGGEVPEGRAGASGTSATRSSAGGAVLLSLPVGAKAGTAAGEGRTDRVVNATIGLRELADHILGPDSIYATLSWDSMQAEGAAPAATEQDGLEVVRTIVLGDVSETARFRPTPGLAAEARDGLGNFILVFGAGLTLIASVVAWSWHRSLRKR